jgi:Na+-translocating ferredoxin:NAD+ oxidoreductase subunit B
MDPQTILAASAILGGVGLTFGVLIALANRKFKVVEDPRIDAVADMLPGNNCGACGEAGCRAFAELLVKGDVQPATCTVMSGVDREDVAAFLGVDAGEANKRVARLLCSGGSDVAPRKALYHGIQSCAAAVAVGGGGKGCAWGCVGYADCQVSCTFDAIRMNDADLPVVDIDRCTACGDCVEACPLDLFALMPLDHKLLVQCKSLLEGEPATALCSVACNACGRCVSDAAPGLIQIRTGLAIIDYDKIELATPAATVRCPTGAILWLEGQQFGELRNAESGVRNEAAAGAGV